MQTKKDRQRYAVSLWTARGIPLVLAGVVGYATYVLVALLCVNYLMAKHDDRRAAIPILVIYFALFLLMAASFFRLLYTTIIDPPYLPLGRGATEEDNGVTTRGSNGSNGRQSLQGPGYSSTVAASEKDSDSPGLEQFYTKDVFRCEPDGKPRWCSECVNWKLDRTSHSSDIGRCIKKMDHFCPWVGGAIGENNFKFFLQFTTYTALYCTHLLVVMAIYFHRQRTTEDESGNSHFAAIIALAGFFGLFTATMSSTSLGFALRNITQVESQGWKTKVYTLAVLIPPPEERIRANPALASQISLRTITYPLSATPPAQYSELPIGIDGRPLNRYLQHVRDSQPIPVDQHQRILDQHFSSVESSSSRDRKATRTFAILSTEAGDNPWSLGSPLLNLQAVMGTSFFDWILPLRRSPCCNHENPESYYAVGPAVDRLRARFGFIAAEDVREKRPHPRLGSASIAHTRADYSHRPANAEELRDVNYRTRAS